MHIVGRLSLLERLFYCIGGLASAHCWEVVPSREVVLLYWWLS